MAGSVSDDLRAVLDRLARNEAGAEFMSRDFERLIRRVEALERAAMNKQVIVNANTNIAGDAGDIATDGGRIEK